MTHFVHACVQICVCVSMVLAQSMIPSTLAGVNSSKRGPLRAHCRRSMCVCVCVRMWHVCARACEPKLAFRGPDDDFLPPEGEGVVHLSLGASFAPLF